MKSPKCPACGKHHWSTQRCDKKIGSGPASRTEVAGSSASGEAKQKTVNHRPQPVGEDNASEPGLVTGDSEVGGSTGPALKMEQTLTPAEKQKAYRARMKADPVKWMAHLEADRKRKNRANI